MSRKHFVALAKMVSDLQGRVDHDARVKIAAELASICQSTNPNFNMDRFYRACFPDVYGIPVGKG